jgi:TonB family protein
MLRGFGAPLLRPGHSRAPRGFIYIVCALVFVLPCFSQSPAAVADWADRFYENEDGNHGFLPESRNVLLDGFDRGSAPWVVSMAGEDGVAETRLFESGGGDAADRSSVLGLKVNFFRRSASTLLISAPRPIPVGGPCSGLSLRVLGRSFRHSLSLVVLDYYGEVRELSLGNLDFTGWRTLRAYIFAGKDPARPWIVQDDGHYLRAPGLRVVGIKLDFDPDEAYGSFYAYFDELRAEVKVEPDSEARGAQPAAAAEPAVPAERESSPEASPAALRVLAQISERIRSALVYPAAARRRGIEGSLVVAFSVAPDGALESAMVAESSGSDVLDRAGLELLRSVFPVENDSGGRLALRIRIAYRLSGGR